jgi:hypothetical protein
MGELFLYAKPMNQTVLTFSISSIRSLHLRLRVRTSVMNESSENITKIYLFPRKCTFGRDIDGNFSLSLGEIAKGNFKLNQHCSNLLFPIINSRNQAFSGTKQLRKKTSLFRMLSEFTLVFGIIHYADYICCFPCYIVYCKVNKITPVRCSRQVFALGLARKETRMDIASLIKCPTFTDNRVHYCVV